MPPPSEFNSNSHRFATTRWSLVVDAANRRPGDMSSNSADANGSAASGADDALAELAQQYWYPLYAFARRRGASVEDAQDWTQGFLLKLTESVDLFAAASPERGRFRAFLITAFKHFIGQQKERDRAQRRGGGLQKLRLDFADGERRYQFEPVDIETPERIFERRWALTVLSNALQELRAYYAAKDQLAFFEACRGMLTMDESSPPQAELAEQLGMTAGSLRTSLHRLRARYRDLLREKVGDTISSREALTDEIDDELKRLREALRRD